VAEHKLPPAEPPRSDQTQLRIGRLTKAHGLKGAIKVELYTDEPDKRFVPGAVFTLQVPTASKWHGKTLTLNELRWYNAHAVAFFEGVDDRSEAETESESDSEAEPETDSDVETESGPDTQS
jgi:16S rRNA processing protein RimM